MPKLLKETTEVSQQNELKVEPGSTIALAIIRNPEGGVSVIASEDCFKDVDDDSVEQILECVKDMINSCRVKVSDSKTVEYVN